MYSPEDSSDTTSSGGRVAVLGVNHECASLSLRESIAFAEREVPGALKRLTENPDVSEALLLSTCNRTEVYVVSASPDGGLDFAATVLDTIKSVGVLEDSATAYRYFDAEAVEHLYAVSCGLDSLMVGEAQILTQVKSAYDLATEAGATGLILNRLFQSALHVGKRARSSTEIGVGAVSVSSAAVGLANKVFGNLSERTALLVGAGESGKLAAEHLVERGIGRLLISNRTVERAEALASSVGGLVVPFESRGAALAEADILLCVTSAPAILFSGAEIGKTVRSRPRRPLLAIDLSVPRDIDPQANQYDNVFLYDIDALEVMVEQSLEMRRKEIPKVQQIVDEELYHFLKWYDSLSVTQVIRDLRRLMDDIRAEHVQRYGGQYCDDDIEKLDQFTRTLMNRILHVPLTQLRAFSQDARWGALRMDTVRELFGLEDMNGSSSDQDRNAR